MRIKINIYFLNILILYLLFIYNNKIECNNDIIFHKMDEKQILRDDFILQGPSNPIELHELIFVIPQHNISYLEELLLQRSNPLDPLYQEWLTNDEINTITKNDDSLNIVLEWLVANQKDITITWQSISGHYIKATAQIYIWEKLLNTIFYTYKDLTKVGKFKKSQHMINRANTYSIPIYLKTHIYAIFNIVQTPPPYRSKYKINYDSNNNNINNNGNNINNNNVIKEQSNPNDVDVPFLKSLYKINSNIASSNIHQAVFQTNTEHFSRSDLDKFQKKNKLLLTSKSTTVNDPSNRDTTQCGANIPTISCYEGNLDMQYIMGIAQNAITTFWYVRPNDPFVEWITAVANMKNPPIVHSISWGIIEQAYSEKIMDTFNTEAMKLGLQGVTITASSGDDGAVNDDRFCKTDSSSNAGLAKWKGASWSGFGYFPLFPASSPWITAVGATMGPEYNTPEVACQSDLGGVITTGGGFSAYYSIPTWQKATVNNYLHLQNNKNTLPNPGYNPNGRAYPDISFIGVNYQTYIGGSSFSLYGTSASSPLFAGMISLLNAQRNKSLGFINPTLYSYAYGGINYKNVTNVFKGIYPYNDITVGYNNCGVKKPLAPPICCKTSGFYACEEWDPTTGLGSIDFDTLTLLFNTSYNAINNNNSTNDDDDDSSSSTSSKAIIIKVIRGIIIAIIIITVIIVISTIVQICLRFRSRVSAEVATIPHANAEVNYMYDPTPQAYVEVVEQYPQYNVPHNNNEYF